MKIKKGDKVKILKGKDKDKTGTVDKVLVKSAKVVVGGVNIYKKHQKARENNKTGSIIEITMPLPVSNVALICPKCTVPTRVGFGSTSTQKSRICRKCKQEF